MLDIRSFRAKHLLGLIPDAAVAASDGSPPEAVPAEQPWKAMMGSGGGKKKGVGGGGDDAGSMPLPFPTSLSGGGTGGGGMKTTTTTANTIEQALADSVRCVL